jgi:hypothetical protein
MPTPDALHLAKTEATAAMSRGLLCSPDKAMAAVGTNVRTLWLIASRVALRTGDSAEDLCEYLEHEFPPCSFDKKRLERNRQPDFNTYL